ncbi:MAG: TIGR02391 family protein [Candidatus Saccharimonadales bacterium]
MQELLQRIPDVSLFLALAPEELGAKMLFLMRARMGKREYQFSSGRGEMFVLSALEAELWPQTFGGQRPTPYPSNKRDEVALALTEAWAWLEAQGLLVPAIGTNGQNGWRVLSRRARAMESEAEFSNYKIARLLPKEILHRKIAVVVWGNFMRGEFDGAAFHAMKAVEVSVRTAAGLGNELVGQALMHKAFAPQDGPLTDMAAESSERQGRSDFFAGTIASYKNPHSHRDVNLDDRQEALEIIYLANHLLRIVDARAKARRQEQP